MRPSLHKKALSLFFTRTKNIPRIQDKFIYVTPSVTYLALNTIITSLITHTHSDSVCTQFCWWHRVVNHSDDRTLAVERWSSMEHKDDWKCWESGSLLLLLSLSGSRSETVTRLSRIHRRWKVTSWSLHQKMLQYYLFYAFSFSKRHHALGRQEASLLRCSQMSTMSDLQKQEDR